MGIMSKNNRLPERPKPPSWNLITEDVEAAENDDVVFVVGKDNLDATALTQGSSSEKNVNASSSSFNSSLASDSDLDTSSYDPEKVKTSYNNVLKLISLYTELKDAPKNMQQQFSHLKDMSTDMTQSIMELKTLAQTMSTESSDSKTGGKKSSPRSPGAESTSSSKGKSKQKKKK